MNLPLFINYGTDLAAVEEQYRHSIRKDHQLSRKLESLSVMLYEHPSGVVGVMYESRYRKCVDEYNVVLAILGFKLVRTVQMPTPHFKMKRVV